VSGYGALAYIVQLNLPGGPIKIGQSCRVAQRVYAYSGGTPVDVRLIGVTFPGFKREREMLDATKGGIIKGEWRLVTPELRGLVAGWFNAGEWFVESGNYKRHFEEAQVAERVRRHWTGEKEPSLGFWNAHQVTAKIGDADPSLLADWHGFARASSSPDFHWPSLKRATA
jgi:hypothetical protein